MPLDNKGIDIAFGTIPKTVYWVAYTKITKLKCITDKLSKHT